MTCVVFYEQLSVPAMCMGREASDVDQNKGIRSVQWVCVSMCVVVASMSLYNQVQYHYLTMRLFGLLPLHMSLVGKWENCVVEMREKFDFPHFLPHDPITITRSKCNFSLILVA